MSVYVFVDALQFWNGSGEICKNLHRLLFAHERSPLFIRSRPSVTSAICEITVTGKPASATEPIGGTNARIDCLEQAGARLLDSEHRGCTEQRRSAATAVFR